MRTILDRPDYRHSHWGLLVSDLTTGEALVEQDSAKLFAPASVTKLFSCSAAWIELGPDHRFETRVVRRGELGGDGTLDGDLVLIAAGDPTLGGRTDADGHLTWKNLDHTYANWSDCDELTEPDPLQGLKKLARQVKSAGVRRVKGRASIDDRLFEDAEGSGSGPQHVAPIMINDNVIDFLVKPGKAGQKATVEWRPQSPRVTIDAVVFTTAGASNAAITVRASSPWHVRVSGTIPVDAKPVVRIHEMPNSTLWAEALFTEALETEGIIFESPAAQGIGGRNLPGTESLAQMPTVAALISPPFRENITLILKVSHNLHASLLPLLLAAKHGERTLAEGLRWQGKALSGLGLDTSELSFAGGAGGTRGDYVTPHATVQLLRSMAQRADARTFRLALPILGRDGTLAKVQSSSPVAGRVYAKTGTLVWENTMNDSLLITSKAIAGYMTAKSGRELVFAIFVNNVPRSREEKATPDGEAMGRLCEIVHERY